MMYLKGKDQYFVVYLAPFLLDASLSEEKKEKKNCNRLFLLRTID